MHGHFVEYLDFLKEHPWFPALIAVSITIATLIWKAILKSLRCARRALKAHCDRRALRKHLGADSYTADDILRATSCYIVPNCQSVDPSGGEDFRKLYTVRENAFQALDKLLEEEKDHKFSLILADSGMGKTSLLLNYYARYWRRAKRRRFKLALVPLGQPNVDSLITRIVHKNSTVLFLDAFDEDTLAIQDHRARLGALLGMCSEFRHVLITCRTQFFPKDEEIPTETGLIRVGPTSAGDSKEHTFYKLYLSPFSNEQVRAHLLKRFPFWHRKDRKRAFKIASQIKDLTVRPMLLAHIPDLLESKAVFKFSFQIYEEMVQAWLKREKHFVKDSEALRDFSERLAVELFSGRERRGAEKISPSELADFVRKTELAGGADEQIARTSSSRGGLLEWQWRGRSLLNRDAVGNLKFAHRTILEYLVVKRFLKAPDAVTTEGWTDQMKRFLWDMATVERASAGKFPKNMHKISYQAAPPYYSPLVELRSKPAAFGSVEQARASMAKVFCRDAMQNWPCICRPLNTERHLSTDFPGGPVSAVLLDSGEKKYVLHDMQLELDMQFETALPRGPISITLDLVTGLKWFSGPAAARTVLKRLDVRPPTLEEALSLAPVLKRYRRILADPKQHRSNLIFQTVDTTADGSFLQIDLIGNTWDEAISTIRPARDNSLSTQLLIAKNWHWSWYVGTFSSESEDTGKHVTYPRGALWS